MTTNIEQVPSFADLRNLKPSQEGVRALLCGWNAGSFTGGGYFIGHLVTKDLKQKSDDGGVVAAGKGYYWERVLSDPDTLTIADFGAIADGTTDIATAAYAMHKYTLANYPGMGIKLPSGKFFLSRLSLPTEINFFRLSGAKVSYGYFSNTVIVTDRKEEFLIDINARWVELSGIQFTGVSTPDDLDKKGVFRNVIPGGQFFKADCIRFRRIGGTCISLRDTLDTKLSQWYASECTGDVLVNTWSDQVKGVWDHTTAVELTNFNIQNCRLGKVFTLPRCTQSIMHNGWIEHCDNPGDISNGHWTMIALSMEDCKNPLKAAYARVTEINRSLQSGSQIDYSDDPALGRWLSEWERGRIDIQNHGIFIDGYLEPGTLMSRYKMGTTNKDPQWYSLGKFYIPGEGDSLDINMVGTGNILSKGAKLEDIDGPRQGGGNTLIRIQTLQSGGMGGTFQPCGSSPVQAVKYVKVGNGRLQVYVQLKPYTTNVIPMITSTSKNRCETGTAYYFEPNVKLMSNEDIAALTGAVDVKEQWSIGSAAGVGATNEGDLILKGKVVTNKDTKTDYLQVQVMVSSQQWAKPELRYLELKKEAK